MTRPPPKGECHQPGSFGADRPPPCAAAPWAAAPVDSSSPNYNRSSAIFAVTPLRRIMSSETSCLGTLSPQRRKTNRGSLDKQAIHEYYAKSLSPAFTLKASQHFCEPSRVTEPAPRQATDLQRVLIYLIDPRAFTREYLSHCLQSPCFTALFAL